MLTHKSLLYITN